MNEFDEARTLIASKIYSRFGEWGILPCEEVADQILALQGKDWALVLVGDGNKAMSDWVNRLWLGVPPEFQMSGLGATKADCKRFIEELIKCAREVAG